MYIYIYGIDIPKILAFESQPRMNSRWSYSYEESGLIRSVLEVMQIFESSSPLSSLFFES